MSPKRLFDILFSATALLILSPVLLVTALVIKLESKGPVFYTSKRVGQFYRIFGLIKFRTMANDADKRMSQLKHLNQYSKSQSDVLDSCPECEKLGYACSTLLYADGKSVCENQWLKQKHEKAAAPFMKFQNDPRVTTVGKFLRMSSIDELPQLFNILKGDMSLVGNRPLPLYEAEQLTTDDAVLRFMAPAGLTGLWQVTKRGLGGELSAQERIELDNRYALEYSFLYDVKLILKTFPALLKHENV
jgi:lipopolysaccharide/colanic/teichoic acid biosynthesis glycosyltransferase